MHGKPTCFVGVSVGSAEGRSISNRLRRPGQASPNRLLLPLPKRIRPKALGLAVAQTLLVAATEVIE
jgi:hypothetical protein